MTAQTTSTAKVQELLTKLLTLRILYDRTRRLVSSEAVSDVLRSSSIRKMTQMRELSKTFEVPDFHHYMEEGNRVLNEIREETLHADHFGKEEYKMLEHLISYEQATARAYLLLVEDCEGEVQKFVLRNHGKELSSQVSRLKSLLKNVMRSEKLKAARSVIE